MIMREQITQCQIFSVGRSNVAETVAGRPEKKPVTFQNSAYAACAEPRDGGADTRC
jgi:hypothetical protein